ncbi:MAG: hypothetical protein EKK41_24205 [Hyphomicrobiales bacterium]|nr:MAG: hypothetical protein EKK41_24205 [Hyphomicrobiales bacterium]
MKTTQSTATTTDTTIDNQNTAGFFINAGTHAGWFTTPDGDAYDIRKLEPREVTDPRTGEVTTIWGGYATARDRELAAKDAMLQAEFKKTGARPAEFFQPESRDIPLYITLRNRPGKPNPETGKPSYTDIGSFWNSRGRYTVLARDLAGKSGLRFGGNVLAWKTPEMLEAERATKSAPAPDGAAARDGADKRARRPREKAATPEA